jgi:predicted HicB family RNase H-like nuclease
MAEETKHINVRLPLDVHAAALKLAANDDRSLNKLIVRLIREAATRPAPKPKP